MEIKDYTSSYVIEGAISPRSVARHVALSSLARWHKLRGRRSSLARERVQFLYLHHVFQDEVEPFRRLLDALSRNHCLISYSEAVDRVLLAKVDKPYVCLSVDDGLKDCLRISQILKEHGVSACFFICPSLVGETDSGRLKEYCALKFGMPPTELLSWDDVVKIIKEGHEIGSHTMTHPILARVSQLQVEDEINRSYECLNGRLGRVDHFAWPLGRFFHFSPSAAKTVFDMGFRSCASAERGCHVVEQPLPERSLCIRRDYISASWPLDHTFYFMVRNCLTASSVCNRWPEGWFEPSRDIC